MHTQKKFPTVGSSWFFISPGRWRGYKQLFKVGQMFDVIDKMETQKIVNFFNNFDNESLKFATRKWYVIND